MSDFPPPGEQPTAPVPPSAPVPPPPPAPAPQSPPAPGWWQASDGNWYPPQSAPGYGPPPAYGPPSGYAPPPAYGGAGYGYTPYASSRGTNGLAIASLVLGILWLEWIGAILAVVFGHVALGQIKRRQQGGRGLAIAGIILGWIWIALLLVVIVVAATSS